MSTSQIDGTAVVTQYFEDRITEAQTEVESARAALAAAEAKVDLRQGERDAFAEHGTLPAPPAGTMVILSLQPEWQLCSWAQSRIADIAFKDMSAAGDAAFKQRGVEEKAAHAWLEQHGYTVPDVFQGEAMTELPHQAYADLIADSLDPGGPSGPYAPDEYLAERYIDGTLVATYYFRRTQPRRVQRDPDLRELDVVLEPVVDAKAWPHGLTLYWTSSEGWQYGPLGAEYEDLADWHEPLPVDQLASPGALRALLPALFAGDTEDLPASTDRWYQPGRSAQLAAQLALAPQDAAYGPEEEAVGMTDADRLRAAVAAVPMTGTVGQLRALLEQLPDEMSLWLDDHHRALPGESDHDALTVHPSLVGVVSEAGTEAARKEHGLMLTQVYVPRVGEEERAAVATRSDLPPDGEHARAAYFLERGELRPGLKDVAQSLMDLTYLVGEVAAGYVETGSDAHQALQVETERITQAAARVSKLADEVKAAQ